MRNKKIGTWVARLLITMLTVLGLGQTMIHAQADGPLTDVIITKVQTNDEAKPMTIEQLRDGVNVATYFTDGKVLPGVSFTYFSVTKQQLETMDGNKTGFDTVDEVEAVVGVGTGTVVGPTNVDGQATISNLPEGYYWVVENAKATITDARAVPFGLILPFTNAAGNGYLRTINVYPKNTLAAGPDIVKTVEESNVAIGDLNIWTVSLDIPVGIEEYGKYSFYDIIDSRLDFEGIEHVIAEATGISLVKGTDYNVSYAAPRLDVVFTEAGRIKLKGANPKKVNIKIKTRVNDTAIMGQDIPNTATLIFNNGHGVDKEKTPGVIPSVHTGGRAFLKKDGSTGAALDGAEFKIKNNNGQFVNVGVNGVISFGGSGTTFTSANGGKFEVKGLPYGEYVLVEIKAPQGYALPTDPETGFTVNATSYYSDPKVIELVTTPANVSQDVLNRRLVIPQTGGIGTAAFTVIGAVMMIFSALFYKRTKEV